MDKGEIVLYQPDDTVLVEVRLIDETVWLTQAQIAELFGTQRPAITKHLSNIYKSGELAETSVCSILEHTAADGKTYLTKFYNLDAILSVGYRVNSINATNFRRWATQVLKDYLLKGYAINQRFERLENRMAETEKKIDFFVNTNLPPTYGLFYNNQVFDAHAFVSDLVKTAKNNITLIDNYINESVLLLLSKRKKGVSAEIYTHKISPQLQLDISKYNSQYDPIIVSTTKNFHDRFLIIDKDVYHIGASVKDLGKKLFVFSKIPINPEILLNSV